MPTSRLGRRPTLPELGDLTNKLIEDAVKYLVECLVRRAICPRQCSDLDESFETPFFECIECALNACDCLAPFPASMLNRGGQF